VRGYGGTALHTIITIYLFSHKPVWAMIHNLALGGSQFHISTLDPDAVKQQLMMKIMIMAIIIIIIINY
jgi:hypothetical protein